MAVMTLRLEKTYRSQGFFNVPVAFDGCVSRHSRSIDIYLDHAETPVRGRINRDANLNHTPRIHGNKPLRKFFQRFPPLALLQVRFLTPASIRILADPSDSTTHAASGRAAV